MHLLISLSTEIDNTFLPKEFSTTITSIGRNLTYLYIFWGLALSDLINNVLPSCPNLTHFGADYCAEEITNKPVVFTDTTFRLTHLFLNLLPGPCLKVYTLREFFACCPKLVTLDFVSEKYHLRDFAYSLIKPCPELENIYFQNAHGYRPRKSWKYRNKTTNNYGLIRLEIVMDHKFNEKALWGILSHHHATLKSIKLYQCDGLGGVSGELCGGSYQLSQLHELYIDNCEHFHPTILQNLLLSCSSLKHLHLVNIDAADDILAQVVAPALRLETLEISHCRKMTVRGLELWIKPNRETLKEVILRSCSISSDAIGLAMEESEKRVEIKGSRYYFH
jgi:hypothetical protein